MVKIKVTKKVVKKRKFPIKIVSPTEVGNKVIGQSSVSSIEDIVGKTVSLGLFNIAEGVGGYNTRATLVIDEVLGGEAKTSFKQLENFPYYLNRSLKKGNGLIEMTIKAVSKDGETIVFKPFLVAKERVPHGKSSLIRAKIVAVLQKQLSEMTASEFFTQVISGGFIALLRNEVKTILPMKTVEYWKVTRLLK